ncbi:GNAT family N-acetyltransferase [Priestia koreensis]|uniref:GNAT family N-acetyltransferase n=1 Tax=Priestia koreensis TaxID=284581 RepID=UPI0028F7092E|nr:GNAT family N-acetyltransferase [Priestia koreensis]
MLQIEPVSLPTVNQAKELIYEGFLDYFPSIDESLNPDLHHILQTYEGAGSLFLIGKIGEELVCTGAFLRETADTARICRMSVAHRYRKNGYAKQMVHTLETQIKALKYKRIVIETTKEWTKPIRLYESLGYTIVDRDGEEVHFEKVL